MKPKTLQPPPLAPLPVIDPRDWQGKAVPDRQWFGEGWIPHRTVTNLSGAGVSGKTEIVLQLIAASSLRTQWFGYSVAEGPCLYFGAEDEADELHRRLSTIVDRLGSDLSELIGVRLIPLAGADAVLAEPDRTGNLKATTIFAKLEAQVRALWPKLIVIDPSADVFGGDEINRAQVRKFVSMLRGLAIDHDCALLLLSHPSQAGLAMGTDTSGSTARNNSVRSRLYMEVTGDDTRVLKVVKANYGRTGEQIALRWDDGVYSLGSGPDPAVARVINKSADDVFMAVFLKLTAQGQALGPNVGPSYAPKKISKHPDAKGYDAHKLAAAMQRLLDAGTLRIEVTGPPSRRYTQLVATSN